MEILGQGCRVADRPSFHGLFRFSTKGPESQETPKDALQGRGVSYESISVPKLPFSQGLYHPASPGRLNPHFSSFSELTLISLSRCCDKNIYDLLTHYMMMMIIINNALSAIWLGLLTLCNV